MKDDTRRSSLSHVISSASEKSFSFAVKRCMRVNGNGKPGAPRMWDTVFHANRLAQGTRKPQQQRSLGCARDDDTRGGIVSHGRRIERRGEAYLFRYVSQPPPLRGTSFQRKEGEVYPSTKAFPREKGSKMRIPFFRTTFLSWAYEGGFLRWRCSFLFPIFKIRSII